MSRPGTPDGAERDAGSLGAEALEVDLREAGGLLGLPAPLLALRLERGELSGRRDGDGVLVRRDDVLALGARLARQEAALDAMVADGEELGALAPEVACLPALDVRARRTSLGERQGLGGPCLRTFQAIADRWGLSEAERRRALGGPASSGRFSTKPSRATFRRWVRASRGTGALALPRPVLWRLSALLGVHAALGTLLETAADERGLLRRPFAGPPFHGRAPLALVLSGSLADQLVVFAYLRARAAGAGIGPLPGENDTPWQDHDIVFENEEARSN